MLNSPIERRNETNVTFWCFC